VRLGGVSGAGGAVAGTGEIQGRSLRCKADGLTDRAAAGPRPATQSAAGPRRSRALGPRDAARLQAASPAMQPAAGPATHPGNATQGRSRSPQPPRARRGIKTHGPETRTNVRSVYIF
jgi:hypothetical protein